MNMFANHDYHIHTNLSSCCKDPTQTPDTILEYAVKNGYDSVCLTDHLWDSAVPGASKWYEPQNIEHVRKSLPFPKKDGIKVYFGCETEFCGGNKLGLARENFDLFDFVQIPINHMHMKGFVRPADVVSVEQMVQLIPQRLEELLELDLPWEKVGIPHLTTRHMFSEGDMESLLMGLDESRMMRIFDICAKRRIGIELNASCFEPRKDNPEIWPWKENPAAWLRLYKMAKKAGCLFYCGSDSHSSNRFEMNTIKQYLTEVVEALELTENDRYIIKAV